MRTLGFAVWRWVFSRIDVKSDMDSQGRFSRGEVIWVGMNFSRHLFRSDLSFKQFSITERLYKTKLTIAVVILLAIIHNTRITTQEFRYLLGEGHKSTFHTHPQHGH